MMRGVVNRLRGQVRLRVETDYPERVMNLCSQRNITFWDLQWQGEREFTCWMSRSGAAALRRRTDQLQCVITPIERRGLPYWLGHLGGRPALAVGAVSCAMGLFLGSFFIWEFRVEGNTTVPTERILRSLESHGVGIGSFGLSLDGEDLRNRVLLDIPELSWLTVNVSGCRADVQVRERVAAPEIIARKPPSNLIARRGGLVLEVHSQGGVKAVVPGMSVEQGQLLLSGVEDTDTFGARTTAGLGEVIARTWHELTTTVPLTAAEKQYGEEKTGISLILGGHRVKFFSNSSITGRKYDKITKTYPLSILGVPLPVRLERETWRFYETVPKTITPAEGEELGRAVLEARLEAEVAPYGEVVSGLCTSRVVGEALEVTLRAECRERIGELSPILVEETA